MRFPIENSRCPLESKAVPPTMQAVFLLLLLAFPAGCARDDEGPFRLIRLEDPDRIEAVESEHVALLSGLGNVFEGAVPFAVLDGRSAPRAFRTSAELGDGEEAREDASIEATITNGRTHNFSKVSQGFACRSIIYSRSVSTWLDTNHPIRSRSIRLKFFNI